MVGTTACENENWLLEAFYARLEAHTYPLASDLSFSHVVRNVATCPGPLAAVGGVGPRKLGDIQPRRSHSPEVEGVASQQATGTRAVGKQKVGLPDGAL
jgi:hypothetical protein